MKLDADYINRILRTVGDHPDAKIEQKALMQAINVTADDKQDFGKFYHHMQRIGEAGFMISNHQPTKFGDGFGFAITRDRQDLVKWNLVDGVEYELTYEGYQFIQTSRSRGTSAALHDALVGNLAG